MVRVAVLVGVARSAAGLPLQVLEAPRLAEHAGCAARPRLVHAWRAGPALVALAVSELARSACRRVDDPRPRCGAAAVCDGVLHLESKVLRRTIVGIGLVQPSDDQSAALDRGRDPAERGRDAEAERIVAVDFGDKLGKVDPKLLRDGQLLIATIIGISASSTACPLRGCGRAAERRPF